MWTGFHLRPRSGQTREAHAERVSDDQVRMITHNALLDELASVTPELGDDVFLVAVIVRIDTQPDSGEIKLPYEALANL